VAAATFTKWMVGEGPGMAGVVGGAVGEGVYEGKVRAPVRALIDQGALAEQARLVRQAAWRQEMREAAERTPRATLSPEDGTRDRAPGWPPSH